MSARKRGGQGTAKPADAPPDAPTKSGDGVADEPAGSKGPSEPANGHGILRNALRKPEIGLAIVCAVVCTLLLYNTVDRTPVENKLWNRDTLALYTGEQGNPYYLAIHGQVFDVTKGKKHYTEKGYNFFLGKDASKAFVTGDFQNDLTDDVDEFGPDEAKSLIDWLAFFKKTYPFKGRLVGRFYNKRGEASRMSRLLAERAATAKSHEEKQREYEAQFPPCNVRWTEAEGGTVWCDAGAYPRRVFTQDANNRPMTRCLCFKELGWSDLRQVYSGCKPDAHECKVAKDGETTAGARK